MKSTKHLLTWEELAVALAVTWIFVVWPLACIVQSHYQTGQATPGAGRIESYGATPTQSPHPAISPAPSAGTAPLAYVEGEKRREMPPNSSRLQWVPAERKGEGQRLEDRPNVLAEPPSGLYLLTGYGHGCTMPYQNGKRIPERPPQPTASGRWPVAGLTVAADPKLHPLGSELIVEGVGWVRVDDTGHKIKGRHLDIFYNTCGEAKHVRKLARVWKVPVESTRAAEGMGQ